MDRRRAAGALLALAACIASSASAPTVSDHTALDLYDGASEGCYYNFQHYGEGDRIMTNEPCLNCTCHNKMLMCYLRVCPFTKPIGQDCTVEKRADQCCPIITCPDVPVDLLTSTSTTSPAEYGATGIGKLDKYGCSINEKYFPEGSKVPPTPNKPCEHCYCIRNMTTCVMQECTLHVDGCTPIYHKDVCCPVRYSCDHPEDEILLLDDMTTTVRPTPGFLLTTTTLSPVTQMTQDCIHDDQVFADGALIKTEKACEHCYCMKGDIVCVVQECGTPMENEGKNCSSLPPREGQCCPDTYICEGDELSTELPSEVMIQEEITTLSPPRRVGVEGSGYRNEPDEAPQTESTATEVEIEGSGEEQSNTLQKGETSDLFTPETATSTLIDEYLATTEKEQQYVPIITESPKLDETEKGTQSPEPSQGINIISEEANTVPDQHVSSTTVVPAKEDQHIPSMTTALVQDVEISSTEPIVGQDLIPGAISEKESSELDQFIPISTSAPLVDNREQDITKPTETQNIIPSTTSVSSEKEQMISITTSAPMVEEGTEPSIEPNEGQYVKPVDDVEVETEEPEDYSSLTTSTPKLEKQETPSVGQDMFEHEVVTEKIHSDIDQSILSTQQPEIDEGYVYTTEISEGDEETAGIITEKESEPELIPVTDAIKEKEDSNIDQFSLNATSLPTIEEHDHHLTTKLSYEKDTTAGFVHTTDSLAPEYITTTMSTSVVEKVEKVATETSYEESSVPGNFITSTTTTPLLDVSVLSTVTPNEEQYVTEESTEKEFSQPQPTGTTAFNKDEKTTLGTDEEHTSISSITSKEHVLESEEPKSTEPTTGMKYTTSAETTTIGFDVTSKTKDESSTITTESSLKNEDIIPTDSQKPHETTTDNIEIITELTDVETKPTIIPSLEGQQTIREDEIKEPVESTTIAILKEDEKEPLSETEGELISTTTATDKLKHPETTTVNVGDNEINEESIISSGRIPGEGDCLLNGLTYRNESIVPSTSNCHIGCKCISSIIKCEPVICSPPPEYMNNCQPTYDSTESCCPTYVCDHSKETIPPESQSQMSGTETPVPLPTIECRGDQCEISEEKIHICTSGDCLKEPSAKPESIDCGLEDCSHVQTPTHSRPLEHPEECAAGKCEPSKESCANGECQLRPIVEQALPVKPCDGNNCEEKPDESNIPQIPTLSCESGSGDCGSTVVSLPQDVKTDVTCTEEKGCQKPQEESKLECVGESCRRKGSSDVDSKLPSACVDAECVQQMTTQHSLDTEILTTKSPEKELDTLETTREPLVTINQEEQTELPVSHDAGVVTTKIPEQLSSEIYAPQEHASSDELITKTTGVTLSLYDLTTTSPEIVSESIEIESPDDKLQKNVTTELPQTEDIHLDTSDTMAHQDTTKQDVPIISDLETEVTTKSLGTGSQDIQTEIPWSPTEKSYDAITETILSPTEEQYVETETPLLPTEKPQVLETETPLYPTKKPDDVETEILESEKDKIVTQSPEDIIELQESTTVGTDNQKMTTELPGTDQAVLYTEEPGKIPETSDCGSEDCKEILTHPLSVEQTKECVDSKCQPSKESCTNGKCDVPSIESLNLTESPIYQKPVEASAEHTDINITPHSPTISDIIKGDTDSTKLIDSPVTPKIIEEFTEHIYESQTTQLVDTTEPQEHVTIKAKQEINHTESPESNVTEPFKETKLPDLIDVDQPSYDVTKSPETYVTETERETKLPISELDELSTELSDPNAFKEESSTEQYNKIHEGITTLSQDVVNVPMKTVTEIIPTLSNEIVTEISDIPHIPDVETDTDSTIEQELTTKSSLLSITTSKNQVETTQIILEEQKTELPSSSSTTENDQPVTEQISQTTLHVTGSSIAITTELEPQEIITEIIETTTEQEKSSYTVEKETYPENYDTESQTISPLIIVSQGEIITEHKITTESMIPVTDEEKIITKPPKDEEIDINQNVLPDYGLITDSPEATMTEEPDQTIDKSETSKDGKIKTESTEQHDDHEITSTKRPIDKEIMVEYPGQPNIIENEEKTTETPIHSVTEQQTSHTESMEAIVTEKENETFDTITSKPIILDETSKTGQHEVSTDKFAPSLNEINDENVPAISSEKPMPSQSTESSTSEPQKESTDEEYITPYKESTTIKYHEDDITNKTPQTEIEYSEPYIPVHHEEPNTGTPIVQDTDTSHKVSQPYESSATEHYDISTKPIGFVDESYTEISTVDLTGPYEMVTKGSEVAITEEVMTKLPEDVTDAPGATDENLDKETNASKSPVTEIHDTFTESQIISEDTSTKIPLSLVTVAHEIKLTEGATDHKTTESEETSEFGGLVTKVPGLTTPQEYVTVPKDIVTKLPGISDIEENKIQTETVSFIPEKTESSTKSIDLPASEMITTEIIGTKIPEAIFTETHNLTESPTESTTLADEIYTEQPSKLHVSGSEQTATDSSVVITDDQSLILSTESSITLVTEAQQITTKQTETQEISTELQNISTETPKTSKPDEQEEHSESYLHVTTESDVSITKKSEFVTEQEIITTIPDHFTTEKLEHSEPHEIPEVVEASSKLPLPEENIIPDEVRVTSENKDETPESTPYLIELEEHTHKLDEELSTTVHPELTTRNVDTQIYDITTEKPTTEEKLITETEKIPVKENETIPSVDTLHPSNELSEKTTQSSIPFEEITSLPTISKLSTSQDVDNKNGTETVITEPSTSTTLNPIEKEQTTLIVPANAGVSSTQDVLPTEQTDDENVSSSVKPLETDVPFVTTPLEEKLISTPPKTTTPIFENATSHTPVPNDKYTKTEEKPSDIMSSTVAPELTKPGSVEEQPTDEVPSPEDGGQIAPSGTSGYGPEPDYFEEDQTFGPGTCRYGGKVYVSAQQIPRDDPCDFCFCFRSDIICLQQSCPPPIHGCHEEPIQGFCCPRYECPVSMATTLNVTTTTTTTTTTLPPHFPTHPYKGAAQRRGCQIKGHTYKVGEVVRASSGPCLHCTCGGDGQMKCDPKACTPEPMLRQMIAAAVSAKRRR